MRLATLLCLALILALLAGPTVAAPSETGVVMIAHPGLTTSTIDRKAVRRIYHGIQRSLGDTPLRPAVVGDSQLHERFTQHILGETPQQFTVFWRRQIFAGKATPPETFRSTSELIEFVRNTPGAIGYLDSAATVEGITIIAVLP